MSKRYLLFCFLLFVACSNRKSLSREQSIELIKRGSKYFDRARSILIENPSVIRNEMIDSATFCFSEAIRVDSTNKSAYRQKMLFENALGEYEKAKATATLFNNKFGDPYALLLLAKIADRMGDSLQSKKYRGAAVKYYKDKIVNKSVQEDSVLLDLATVYYFNGEVEKAREYYYRYRDTKWGQMTFKDVDFDSLTKIIESEGSNAR